MEHQITQYCRIRNQQIHLNGKEIFHGEQTEFLDFIKAAYKEFTGDYPKFYKMDPLCKLSLVMGSLMLDNIGESLDSNTALLLSNKSSCIDIDREHQKNIDEDGIAGARPGNFVYTLPNIALGEISIKYSLRSENSFFIFDHFNPSFMIDYARIMIDLGKCTSVLGGWLEVNGNSYDGFMFLIEPKEGLALTEENLLNLYD
ncbi:MAG: 3-oxoacyl-ACP synthase [Brumimicrobium sp.]|nr:3-oxoacyl-ACP synthase [Brumimicrobium sp.]MCO5269002.1 3-oxoacyl-ACP synthase [Brumimicrobium sp.]